MDKISSLIADHAMKYDSGIDASVLTHNFSSISLDSSDSSYGSGVGDVLNRARIDSMDGDLSIKEELNRAGILSQDFTLDSIGLSADDDVGETHINVSIKLTNNRQAQNKENLMQLNKYSKLFKADNGNMVACQLSNCRYGANKLTNPSPKAKPLSPNKNNCKPHSSPNVAMRAGPKKANTRKKRTVRNSLVSSPPKPSQVGSKRTKGLNNASPHPPGVKNSVKSAIYIPVSKATSRSEAHPKPSSVAVTCSDKMSHLQGIKSPHGKEDSVYSTPVQTPSKLNNLTTTLSSNVTTRSSSPREKILNSQFVTTRSTPSSQKTSHSPSPTSSWYSAEDSLEFFPNELSSSYCSSPNANWSKQYFSPLFDDSAIVEASCSGKKYFNFPEAVNLEDVWAQEVQPVTERQRSFLTGNLGSCSVTQGDTYNNRVPCVGHSLLGERLEKVLNIPVSPQKSLDEQSYVDFQKFLDRLEGTTKVRKKCLNGKLSLSLDDSKSVKSSPTLSPLCCDCRLPDELSEAELDEITWIHTTCNGQQVASRVFFGEQTSDSFAVFPPPRSPRHLKWSENLVQEEYDKIASHNKTTSTPLKSILKKRPDHFVFPYNGDEPSPYLITRTRQLYSPV